MKLFIVSTCRSAALMNSRMAAEEMPCSSGVLRRRAVAGPAEHVRVLPQRHTGIIRHRSTFMSTVVERRTVLQTIASDILPAKKADATFCRTYDKRLYVLAVLSNKSKSRPHPDPLPSDGRGRMDRRVCCLLYTSDAADEEDSVDL